MPQAMRRRTELEPFLALVMPFVKLRSADGGHPGGLHPGHLDALSKSQVSRLCGEIDERVQTFLHRPIEGEWPYLDGPRCSIIVPR
jgi:hypothetical protein